MLRRLILLCLLTIACICVSNCKRSFSPPPRPGKSTIEGVVLRDSDGSIVSGAVVLLCHDAVFGAGCSPKVGETVTDAKGRYSFRDIPPGEYVAAVQVSKQAVYVMQRQSLGKLITEAVKYGVAPGETFVVPDLRLDREPEKLDEPAVRLIYPVSSMSVSDPHPTLKWESVAGAKYFAALTRIDGDKPLDVPLTDHAFQEIETNSIAVKKDLDDGLYEWTVYVSVPNNEDHSIGGKKATAYFTVAKESGR
jgi:hypothetical protein